MLRRVVTKIKSTGSSWLRQNRQLSFNGIVNGFSRAVTAILEFLARFVRVLLGHHTPIADQLQASHAHANQPIENDHELESAFDDRGEEPFHVVNVQENDSVAVPLPTSVQEALELEQASKPGLRTLRLI